MAVEVDADFIVIVEQCVVIFERAIVRIAVLEFDERAGTVAGSAGSDQLLDTGTEAIAVDRLIERVIFENAVRRLNISSRIAGFRYPGNEVIRFARMTR
ncbi:hypothetical protein AZE99_02840 [Sphingorhabdus sp. M41]|nr:hypothetical protein AZE99_02840 [Sphingorhabdus sp. M41]